MVQIEKDKNEADETRAVVVKEEAVASTKAEECQQIKDSAERDLAEALPALDAAVAVLRNLKQSDLSEVAKYANPPAGVKLVIEAMCVMKGVQPKKVGAAGAKVDDYWEPGKKMLQDAKGLLESMFSFDKDNIPDKVITKIQPYIDNEDFQPKKIESVSKVVAAKPPSQSSSGVRSWHAVGAACAHPHGVVSRAGVHCDVPVGARDEQISLRRQRGRAEAHGAQGGAGGARRAHAEPQQASHQAEGGGGQDHRPRA